MFDFIKVPQPPLLPRPDLNSALPNLPSMTTATLDALARLDSRLIRMETRLVRLMDANGLDCDGKKRAVVE